MFVKQLQPCRTQKKVIYQLLKNQVETQKRMSFLKGEDIFGKYDYTKSKDDSETPASDMETDEDSPNEDKYHKRKHDRRKTHKPSPWDRLIERAYDSVQEQFNESVENALKEDSSMEMIPNNRSVLTTRYQDVVNLCSNLNRDPTHKKVLATANRLRYDEVYDEEEAMKYALEKRRYLLDRKLDEYDRPSYVENGTEALIPVRKTPIAAQTTPFWYFHD